MARDTIAYPGTRRKASRARLAPLIKVLLALCAIVFAALIALFVFIFLDRGNEETADPTPAPRASEAGSADPLLLGRWIELRYGIVIAFFGDGKADNFHPFAGTMRAASYSVIEGQLMISGGGVDAAFTYAVDGDKLVLTPGESGFVFEELSAEAGEPIVFQELVSFFEEDSGLPIPSGAKAELSELILSGASMPEIIDFVEGIEPVSG